MKKLTVKKGIDCQACLSCSMACSRTYFKVEDQEKAFVQIRMKGAAPAPFVCIQCGKCARNCPEEAITQNAKGVYMINKKKCVACGICAKACPMEMLEVVES